MSGLWQTSTATAKPLTEDALRGAARAILADPGRRCQHVFTSYMNARKLPEVVRCPHCGAEVRNPYSGLEL